LLFVLHQINAGNSVKSIINTLIVNKKIMPGKTFCLCLILALSLFLFSAQALTLNETFEELDRTIFNRKSEMDTDILIDFKTKYKCDDCNSKSIEGLLREFENFKRSWIDNMVNFVIEKMGIDAEKAQFVRASPEKYFVDYETYKSLRFV
jgi:hypothetical protein